jgi:hypothetical protein
VINSVAHFLFDEGLNVNNSHLIRGAISLTELAKRN